MSLGGLGAWSAGNSGDCTFFGVKYEGIVDEAANKDSAVDQLRISDDASRVDLFST